MKIALTSPNARTLSGHAGKCPGFLVFEITDRQIIQQSHIKLNKEQVLRNLKGALSNQADHPLSDINVFVTQSLGEGLQRRLTEQNIEVFQTQENDPINALKTLNLVD
ncbi:NifB/NifX family molybdenum-iron cluster-binding protein [Thiomicrorhabdus chilensis]|uniref:NifB/NifX family molybdenum-iron cluster-binding protein n=1 Tax=Thiomicrorhabdus chilensis TaxID=63656 RepID=UPI00041A064B|nr:NifB/NifX family molybdenum-iron cluster-binding protein [Thiomicrorhabdus chilensis]